MEQGVPLQALQAQLAAQQAASAGMQIISNVPGQLAGGLAAPRPVAAPVAAHALPGGVQLPLQPGAVGAPSFQLPMAAPGATAGFAPARPAALAPRPAAVPQALPPALMPHLLGYPPLLLQQQLQGTSLEDLSKQTGMPLQVRRGPGRAGRLVGLAVGVQAGRGAWARGASSHRGLYGLGAAHF